MEGNPPARLSPVSWVSPFCLPSGTAGWSLFRSTTFLKEGPLGGRFSSCPQVGPSVSIRTRSHPPCPSPGPRHFAWQILARDAESHEARAGPRGSSGLRSTCAGCPPRSSRAARTRPSACPVPPARNPQGPGDLARGVPLPGAPSPCFSTQQAVCWPLHSRLRGPLLRSLPPRPHLRRRPSLHLSWRHVLVSPARTGRASGARKFRGVPPPEPSPSRAGAAGSFG